MTPEQWRAAEELFHIAYDLPPGARAAFLIRQCGGDSGLQAAVEQLLSSKTDISGSAIEAVVSSAAADWAGAERPLVGRQIGPYLLTSLIGEGGMGSVYRAIREDEFRKEVALKLVKPGMDTKSVVLRFRNERQILANLQHPNIAHLLDGGVTVDGLPYFVMELIEGVPITAYCAARQLGIRDRLSLLRTVCEAVQHAHRNLVVHRDLKPGNILVTGDGVVKLLDFGIAKVLESDGPQATQTAETRMFTPDYGAPEQVRGEPISTATDVYALGAVLFELLTGKRPHGLTSYSTSELIDAICNREAPRLSQAAPPELRRALRGDLENIVARALTKDPARRYASADLFGRDVASYLAGNPVSARPDTRTYRVAKFVQRHRVGVASVALACALLIATAAVAVREALKARERFNQVRSMAHTFLFEFHDELDRVPGNTKAKALLVSTAREYLDNLAASAGNDRGLLLELSEAYDRLAAAQGGSSDVNLGQRAAALESRRRALDLRLRLADPGIAQSARVVELAGTISNDLRELGRYEDSLAAGRRAVDFSDRLLKLAPPENLPVRAGAHMYLARILGDRGELAEAESELAKSEQFLAASSGSPVHRQLAMTRQDRADLLSSLGMLDEAVRLNELVEAANLKEIAAAPPDRMLIRLRRSTHVSWAMLAEFYDGPLGASLDDPKRSLFYREKLCAGWRDSVSIDPNDNSARVNLAVCDSEIAMTLLKLNPAEAVARARRGLDVFREMEHASPNDNFLIYRSARGATRLALALIALGRPADARSIVADSLTGHRKVVAAQPDNPRFTSSLAWTLTAGAGVERALNNAGAARQHAAEAVRLIDPLLKNMDVHYRRMAAEAYAVSGDLAEGEERCSWRRRAVAVWEGWHVNQSPWVKLQLQDAASKAASCADLQNLH